MASLKITKGLKRRFDRLQATVGANEGKRVTQAELLDRLLREAEASPRALAETRWRPLDDKAIERVMALPMDLGFELGDVDEAVYGRKRTAPR